MIANMFREMETQYPSIPESRMIHEVIRRLINRMIVDLTRQTVRNIKESGVKTPEDIRKLGTPVVQFSKNMQQNMAAIKTFLYEHMYRHYKVCRMTSKARRVVQELYTLFFDQPECLPTEWRFKATNVSEAKKSEIVADFIAGMTDRFATDEHRRLFDIEARY
jgi:dGTPase